MDEKDWKIQELERLLKEKDELIRKLETRILELEKRLGLNSQNSSKPPSSDGFKKPNKTSSLREKGRHNSGGQKGHTGYTLKQIDKPDRIVNHRLTICPNCQTSLSDVKVCGVVKRQVFDIPKPKVEVIEHQTEIKVCPCCAKRVRSNFPEGIGAATQYGTVLKSTVVYLQQQHFIPEKRLQEICMDLFSMPIAKATLVKFSEECNAHLSVLGCEKALKKTISRVAIKHLDETGFRINGKIQWLHVASTENMTHYRIDEKRGAIPIGLTGIVVHDHWKPYYKLKRVRHALCHAHHLRELKALVEYEHEQWALKMWRFLRIAKVYRESFVESIPRRHLKALEKMYDRILDEGFAYHKRLPAYRERREKQGRTANRTGYNLLLRLDKYKEDVLRFLKEEKVPFTNNQAERDLRMMKLKQKISGGFRTRQGADIFVSIRSFISTMRKQKQDIFQGLYEVLSNGGDSVLPLFTPS